MATVWTIYGYIGGMVANVEGAVWEAYETLIAMRDSFDKDWLHFVT